MTKHQLDNCKGEGEEGKFNTIMLNFIQGILNEGEGSVQLTSLY